MDKGQLYLSMVGIEEGSLVGVELGIIVGVDEGWDEGI